MDEEITTTARTIALAHSQSFEMGVEAERKRIIARLNSYCDLTRYSQEVEGAESNPEWDHGFQAAIALIKETTNV